MIQNVIIDEKLHLDQVVSTLGMKDITQGALIRKCRMASSQNFGGFRLTTLNADQHARSGYSQYSVKGVFTVRIPA
ncbi:hypothetical protein QNH99_21770 (plasmid) [Pantoea allii]|uniref:hypothetical protein n=1 Tax=Pantoea allii TaxID=574096 RepID=UPI00397767D0